MVKKYRYPEESGSDSSSSDSDDNEETSLDNDKPDEDPGTRERQWDVFQEVPPPVDSGSAAAMVWARRFEKAMLIFSIIITFFVVLLSAMVGKAITLFMIAQVSTRNDRVLEFCNENRLVPDTSKRYELQLFRPDLKDKHSWTDQEKVQADRLETEQVNHSIQEITV